MPGGALQGAATKPSGRHRRCWRSHSEALDRPPRGGGGRRPRGKRRREMAALVIAELIEPNMEFLR